MTGKDGFDVVQISTKVPREVLEAIDKNAEALFMNRSAYMNLLLLDGMGMLDKTRPPFVDRKVVVRKS